MNNLPNSWVIAPLEYIARVEMGQSPESRFYNNRGEGLPFFQGKTEFGPLYPTVRKWCTDPKKIADKDDILLSVRAPVGPTNVATEQCCIGRGLAAVRAHDPISQTYLLHLFRNMESWLSEQGTGTTFAAVSGQFLRSIDVALAPLNEQKRIADKLDAVLARVDACRDRLDRIPAILKRFRQSVLAAATSGKLTEEWREENNITGTWGESTLLSLTTKITDGEHITPKRSPSGKFLLSARNIQNGSIALGNVDYVDDLEFDRIRRRCNPEIGDVLLSCSGSVGRAAMVDRDNCYVMVRSAAMIRPRKDLLHTTYLMYCLQSPYLQVQIEAKSKATAQANIFLGAIKELVLPLPELQEQTEIVRRVEALFAYADRFETRHKAARAQVEKLTPAALAKAFRGELVPQDPNDEPASVLLARIHAQRNDPRVGKPSRSRRRQ